MIVKAREKMERGERLTKAERDRIMEEYVFTVADISGGVRVKGGKYAGQINVQRMDLTEEGEKVLRKTVKKFAKFLEEIRGKRTD